MENSTPPVVYSALPDIGDKPEDTPRSVESARRFTSLGVFSLPLALATMVTPIAASHDPFSVAQDRTAFAEEARAEEWSSLPPDTMSPFEEASQVSEAEVANRTARLARPPIPEAVGYQWKKRRGWPLLLSGSSASFLGLPWKILRCLRAFSKRHSE